MLGLHLLTLVKYAFSKYLDQVLFLLARSLYIFSSAYTTPLKSGQGMVVYRAKPTLVRPGAYQKNQIVD